MKIKKFIPGHGPTLQLLTSFSLPVQTCPSGSGGGLLQNRKRDLVPPSQEFEHSDHSSHEPHAPLTKVF